MKICRQPIEYLHYQTHRHQSSTTALLIILGGVLPKWYLPF